MSFKFGSKTDVGLKRRNNQDNFVIVRGEALNGELDALFVVADGMGGKAGGEVASEIVVNTLPESLIARLEARNGDRDPLDAEDVLEAAIHDAHERVREGQNSDVQLRSMGTTCVAAILNGNRLTVGNVGDSRAYILRDGELRQITQDHSSVWEQVMAGHMTADEARMSRFRNQITRAMGSELNAVPDIQSMVLLEGDSILLCSDGLTAEIDDYEITRLLAGTADPQEACESLVDAALSAGGRDNITVLTLRYGDFTPVSLEMRAAPPPQEMSEGADTAWRAAGFDPEEFAGNGSLPAAPLRKPVAQTPAFVLALLFVLGVAVTGETYALVKMNRDYTRLRSRPPEVIVRPPDRPTDHELTYAAPIILSPKRVRSLPLSVDNDGGVLAATLAGSLVKFDAAGQAIAIPNQSRLFNALETDAPAGLLIASDPSANRYQINPGSTVIAKYDADGVLKAPAIGRGGLTAPTAIAVDKSGDIYVIDDHHVKKIAASAAPAGSSR